jgi:hypothetical protein
MTGSLIINFNFLQAQAMQIVPSLAMAFRYRGHHLDIFTPNTILLSGQ